MDISNIKILFKETDDDADWVDVSDYVLNISGLSWQRSRTLILNNPQMTLTLSKNVETIFDYFDTTGYHSILGMEIKFNIDGVDNCRFIVNSRAFNESNKIYTLKAIDAISFTIDKAAYGCDFIPTSTWAATYSLGNNNFAYGDGSNGQDNYYISCLTILKIILFEAINANYETGVYHKLHKADGSVFAYTDIDDSDIKNIASRYNDILFKYLSLQVDMLKDYQKEAYADDAGLTSDLFFEILKLLQIRIEFVGDLIKLYAYDTSTSISDDDNYAYKENELLFLWGRVTVSRLGSFADYLASYDSDDLYPNIEYYNGTETPYNVSPLSKREDIDISNHLCFFSNNYAIGGIRTLRFLDGTAISSLYVSNEKTANYFAELIENSGRAGKLKIDITTKMMLDFNFDSFSIDFKNKTSKISKYYNSDSWRS